MREENEEDIVKLAGAMAGRGALCSPQRAARRLATLAGNGSPDAARVLAGAFATSHRERVVEIAGLALAGLSDQGCIDAVCDVWTYRSSAALDGLLAERGWIAARPPYVRARTALHAGRGGLLADGDELIATSLVTIADGDRVPELRERARAALRALREPQAQEAVCTKAIDGSEDALLAAVTAGYAPRDAGRRALLLFLAGKHHEYSQLDFDGSLLRAAHQGADASLRRRLAAAARGSGRLEWVRAVTVTGSADRLAMLSGDEWETTRGLLTTGRRWDELWRLALDAPPARAAEILAALPDDWHPASPPGHAGYRALTQLAKDCAHRYPVARALLEPVPGNPKAVRGLAVSPEGGLLAAGNDNEEIWLWRLPHGEPAGHIDARPGSVRRLAFSPDGRLLVSGGSAGLKVWQLPDGRRADRGYAEGEEFAIGPDGRTVLTPGSYPHSPALRRLPTMRPLRELLEHDVRGSLVSAPGRTLVAACASREIQVLRLPSGRQVATVRCGPPVAFAPDGRLIATAGNCDLRLWHLPSGLPAAGVLAGHTGQVLHVLVTPDNNLLASAGWEGTVRLWRLPDGEPVAVLPVHDPPQHRGWPPHPGQISALAATPDSRLLIAGSHNGTVRLWRLSEGEPAGVLDGDGSEITGIAVTADAGLVASASESGSVRLLLPGITEVAATPAVSIGLAGVERLRSRLGQSEAERPWIELISILVRWRHRHDIEVSAAESGTGPAAADIMASD